MTPPTATPPHGALRPGRLALRALPLAVVLAGVLLGISLLVSKAVEGPSERDAASPPALSGSPPHAGWSPPDLGPAPDFSLVSDQGKTVTRGDYRGSVWIADFIFLRCAGQCPLMTSKMKTLAEALPAATGIRFVSFDVDPEHDTVGAMASYAKEHGADPARWRFLRGEKAVIRSIAREGFKLAVEDGDPNGPEPVLHSTRFLLVDAAGRLRGAVDSEDPAALARLTSDARRLSEEAAAGAFR